MLCFRDELLWLEHGANRAKVVGLIPYRPFPEELDLMVFVGPRRFCELTDMNQVAIKSLNVQQRALLSMAGLAVSCFGLLWVQLCETRHCLKMKLISL